MASAPVPARTRSSHLSLPRGSWDLHRPCGDLVVYTCLRQNPGFASVPAGTWGKGGGARLLGDSQKGLFFFFKRLGQTKSVLLQVLCHLPTLRSKDPPGWTSQRHLPCLLLRMFVWGLGTLCATPGQRFVFVLSSPTLWSCRCMWLCKPLIASPKCNEPPCKVLLFLVVFAPAVRNTVTVAWSQLQLPRRPISFLLWEGVSEPCPRLKNHLTSAEHEVWFQIEKLRLMPQ